MNDRSVRSLFCAAILIAVAAVSTFAQSAQSEWKEYSYPSDGFSVSAPLEPVFSKHTQNTATGAAELHSYAIELGGDSGVMVSCSQLAVPEGVSPAKLLQSAKVGMINAVHAKLTSDSEKEIALAGYSGLHFEAENEQYLFRTRIYWVKGILLQVLAVAPKSGSIPASADRILDSVKIIPAAAGK